MKKPEGIITILGTEYRFSFKMKAIRLFMQAEGLTKIADFDTRIASLSAMETLADFDALYHLLLAAITAADEAQGFDGLDRDNVLDDLMANPDHIAQVFEAYATSLDGVDTENPVPSGKLEGAK